MANTLFETLNGTCVALCNTNPKKEKILKIITILAFLMLSDITETYIL